MHANRLKPYYNPDLRPTNIPKQLVGQQITEIPFEQEEQTERENEQENDQEVNAGNNQEDLELERILKAAHYKGSLVYKAKYRNNEDGRCKSIWVYSGDLPEDVRKNFHTKYTFSGKARKLPKP